MRSAVKCAALSFCLLALTTALLLSACGQAKPDAAALDLLRDAWKEYQYREFDEARALFAEAFKKSARKEDKLQALTGQAFCLQFGKRALAGVSDFEGAIALYRKALEIAAGDRKFEPFFKAMLAECSWRVYSLNGDDAKLKDAEDIWASLATDAPKSLVSQDALLFKTLAGTDSFADEGNVEKMKDAAAYLESLSDAQDKDASALAAVFADYLSTVCFWRGDYKGSELWLREYLKLGPTSYSAKTNAVFKVARINDLKLGDKKAAAEYYALFAKSFPVDKRRYFSERKAAELGGKEAGN